MILRKSSFFALSFVFIVMHPHQACEISEFHSPGPYEKQISMQCDGKNMYTVGVFDGCLQSALRIVGDNDRNLFTIQFFKGSKDISITIKSTKFDVKNGVFGKDEERKFKELVADPAFQPFLNDGIKLIHDQLQLKGWESPAVGFLYRLGIAAEKDRISKSTGDVMSLEKRRPRADLRVYLYHGPDAVKKCKYNGYSTLSDNEFISQGCPGLCGPRCHCWKWVCGDCCQHPGCNRHDDFCYHLLSLNCLTFRGVLWDKKKKTPFDC